MSEVPFKDTGPARRKRARREFDYSAMLVASDGRQWPASIVDISEAGAQLAVRDASDLAEAFSLLIGGKNAVRRECTIVWRSGARVGVAFNRRPEPRKHRRV
jgi:hypothetical protein